METRSRPLYPRIDESGVFAGGSRHKTRWRADDTGVRIVMDSTEAESAALSEAGKKKNQAVVMSIF